MRQVAKPTEVAGGVVEGLGETSEATNDDEDAGEEEDRDSQETEGVDLSSEGEGTHTSMSTRSESKPYSSVTHRCEVRYFCFLLMQQSLR